MINDVRLGAQEDGADIITWESRPPIYGDSKPVSVDEELGRVLPMIEAITRETDLPVSIDTYKGAWQRLRCGSVDDKRRMGVQRDPDM